MNSESSVSTIIAKTLIFQASTVAITKLGSFHPGENGKRTCRSKASEHRDEATALSSVYISVGLAPMSFLSLPPVYLLLT
jgi:hypothetical protein